MPSPSLPAFLEALQTEVLDAVVCVDKKSLEKPMDRRAQQ